MNHNLQDSPLVTPEKVTSEINNLNPNKAPRCDLITEQYSENYQGKS